MNTAGYKPKLHVSFIRNLGYGLVLKFFLNFWSYFDSKSFLEVS